MPCCLHCILNQYTWGKKAVKTRIDQCMYCMPFADFTPFNKEIKPKYVICNLPISYRFY